VTAMSHNALDGPGPATRSRHVPRTLNLVGAHAREIGATPKQPRYSLRNRKTITELVARRPKNVVAFNTSSVADAPVWD
jgi:hypothetical protein